MNCFDLAENLAKGLMRACPEIKKHYSQTELECNLCWQLTEIEQQLSCNDNDQGELFAQCEV